MNYDFWNISKTSYLYENLNEGLIKSYDLYDVENHLNSFIKNNVIKSIVRIYENPYKSRGKKYSNDEFARIYLNLDLKSILSYNKVVDCCYNLFGWFVGIIEIKIKTKNGYKPIAFNRGEPYKRNEFHDYKNCFFSEETDDEIRQFILKNQNNIYSIALIIEQKFPIREFIYDFKNEVFYHITDKKFLNKILKFGLEPRSNYNYPSRIYLSNDKNDLINDLDFNIVDKVLLTIKLNKARKIYYDPRSNGFFTYENIHPDEIKQYEEI